MVKVAFMRGLQNFIEEIRACENKEQEEKRILKELAKIREKFGDGDKDLTGYDKRKYVWKLLYISILGYNVDFGHRQACDLIPRPKYKDKQVGYMACTILLNENDEFLRLAINGVHQDLISRNEAFECLALSFVGSVGGQEMAEALVPDILKLLGSGSTRPMVKKRAALCLLRMVRKSPVDTQVVNPDTFCSCLNALLEERDIGLLLSCVTLLGGIVARSGIVGYESCQGRLLRILERLVLNPDKDRDIPVEYMYYGIPSPWLQAKALRTLQYFPIPEAPGERLVLVNILQAVIATQSSVDHSKITTANKNNALYAIILEAIALALHLDIDEKLVESCITALTKMLTTKEPNVKYLALESLARLAGQPDVIATIRSQRTVISAALREIDVATRKRALDLIFAVCDASNIKELVAELLDYLVTADFSIREELVLKVAILAEKHAPDVRWYIDTLFRLLECAGDFVSEEIWQRVAQLVTNNESMQEYAASKIVEVLRRGATYEYRLLRELFATAGNVTKALLMSAFLKIYLQDSQNAELKTEVLGMFERCERLMDAELAQRAAEYQVLAASPESAAAKFLLPMPKWPERESTLVRQLQKQEGAVEDAVSVGASAPSAAASAASAGSMSRSQLSQALDAGGSSVSLPGPAEKLPSINLLGDEASLVPEAVIATAGDPFDVLATATSVPAATPARQSSNPLDLLADLLTAPAHPHAASPQQQQQQPFGVPAPHVGAAAAYPSGVSPAAVTAAFPAAFPAHAPAAFAPAATPVAPGLAASASASFSAPSIQSSGASLGPTPATAPASFLSSPPVAAELAPVAPSMHASAVSQVPFGGAVPPWGVSAAALDDPFGDNAFGPPPSAAAATASSQFEPAHPVGDISAWFRALLLKDRGVLYEDQYLQVGVQTHYADGRGDLILFMGNKSEHALQGVSVSVRPSSSVHVAASAAPPQMLPKQQVQVSVSLTCLGPVTDMPLLTIAYVLGNMVVKQDLQLPVGTHKFIMPEPGIPKEYFFDQWKAVSGNVACKVQQMVSRATALSPEVVVGILRQSNLGVEHCYLDPSPYNEAGAGYFVYGLPGAQQRALTMCRVEGNPQGMAQFRVTVVSPLPGLSASISDMVVANLTA